MSSEVSITNDAPKDMAIVLEKHEPDGPVVMISTDFGGLVIQGENFASPEAAIEAGRTWRKHLSLAFARETIGVNFGDDSRPWFPESFERAAAEGKGLAVADTGLIVFEKDARILFGLSGSRDPWASPASFVSEKTTPEQKPLGELVAGPVLEIGNRSYTLDQRQELAYTLLHNSFFESNPETKNITLITAVEAMIDQPTRSADIVATLDDIRKHVKKKSRLNKSDKDTVLNALGNVKRQSINEGGQLLARKLLDKEYDRLAPDRFFKRSYVDRCNLVHGSTGRPNTAELKARNPILLRFVIDLLDASVFGPQSANSTEDDSRAKSHCDFLRAFRSFFTRFR